MYFSTAFEWLDWISSLHTSEIDLGLDRVKKVAERLKVLKPDCPVIIVGGTNGKGSTVAGLETLYRIAGFRTGAFTTPFLFRYNEQVRIEGRSVSDEEFCAAFANVEAAREDVSLTPFEFITLAALSLFKDADLDVWILEVGLGGRLDAVNIIDADVSVVTSIGIDHVQWLGDTREAIAFEKAGIFRKGKPAVCGDPVPPVTLLEQIQQKGAKPFCLGDAFSYQESTTDWTWQSGAVRYDQLPRNALAIQNMAIVLMVITLLQNELPVSHDVISEGLREINLPGRQQTIREDITRIYDVSHNSAAVKWLADKLHHEPCSGKTFAIFSMLEDKDMVESIKCIHTEIDTWYVAPLSVKRASSMEKLKNAFAESEVELVWFFETIEAAAKTAYAQAVKGDRLVVFGSFHTVADVFRVIEINVSA